MRTDNGKKQKQIPFWNDNQKAKENAEEHELFRVSVVVSFPNFSVLSLQSVACS
jgi:hypothetical protein